MKLTYRTTKQDYIRTVRARSLTSFKRPWFLIIAPLFTALWICRGSVSLAEGDLSGVIFLLAPFLIMLAIFGVFGILVPMRIGAQVQQSENRILDEVQWLLDDTQIIIKDPHTELRVDWGTFRELVELKDYYLLVHTVNKNMFNFIPKRVFESADQEQAFCELVRQNIRSTA